MACGGTAALVLSAGCSNFHAEPSPDRAASPVVSASRMESPSRPRQQLPFTSRRPWRTASLPMSRGSVRAQGHPAQPRQRGCSVSSAAPQQKLQGRMHRLLWSRSSITRALRRCVLSPTSSGPLSPGTNSLAAPAIRPERRPVTAALSLRPSSLKASQIFAMAPTSAWGSLGHGTAESSPGRPGVLTDDQC